MPTWGWDLASSRTPAPPKVGHPKRDRAKVKAARRARRRNG